jgi:hypothetical protein
VISNLAPGCSDCHSFCGRRRCSTICWTVVSGRVGRTGTKDLEVDGLDSESGGTAVFRGVPSR